MTRRTPTRRGGRGRSRVSTTKASPRVGLRPKLAALRDRIRAHLGRQTDDVWGIALIVAALLVVLGFLGLAGPFGRAVRDGSEFLFGLWRYLVPVGMAAIGVVLIAGKPRQGAGRTISGSLTAFLGSLAMFHLLTGAVALSSDPGLVKARGGAVGALLAFPLKRLLGTWGTFVVLAAVMSMGVLLITRTSVRELAAGAASLARQLRSFAGSTGTRSVPAGAVPPRHLDPEAVAQRVEPVSSPPARKRPARVAGAKPVPKLVAVPTGSYQLPPAELLGPGGGEEQSRKALEDTADQLEETLRQHGVDAQLTKIVAGPTVTRFE